MIKSPTNTATLPLIVPDDFDKKVEKLSFSNGRDDRNLVKLIYRNSFMKLFPLLKSIDVSKHDLNYVHSIPSIMQQGFTPNLTRLQIESNNLGVSFCELLANAFQNPVVPIKLRTLNLNDNPRIGDNGITILAPFLWSMEEVFLRNVGMGDDGCQALADHLSLSLLRPTSLFRLFLSKNKIRNINNALNTIIESKTALKELEIQHNLLDGASIQELIRKSKMVQKELIWEPQN